MDMDEAIFDRQLEDHLCFQLYRASNEVNKLYSQALKSFELTFSQYLVLLALWDRDGVSISEIGLRTGMGIGTLNPILKRLTAHEWVQRKSHKSDKRTMLIFLSPKAKETKHTINQTILKKLMEIQIDGAELSGLIKQLGLLQENLNKGRIKNHDYENKILD